MQCLRVGRREGKRVGLARKRWDDSFGIDVKEES